MLKTLLSKVSRGRNVSREDNEDLQYVREYQPKNVSHLRVLVYRAVGAGKSSFINSVRRVLGDRSAIPAGDDATDHNSHTKTRKMKQRSWGAQGETTKAQDQHVNSSQKHSGLDSNPGSPRCGLTTNHHEADKKGKETSGDNPNVLNNNKDLEEGSGNRVKYETHSIEKTEGVNYPIVFNDIMGLEDGSENGVRLEDIKLVMEGHVKEGDEFNPASALSQGNPDYNQSLSLDDKVHVVVFVHSATSQEIKESVLQNMKEIREMANDLGIPQVAVITEIDEACEGTPKDLKNIDNSKHLKKMMSDFSAALGLPVDCIFPIKSYSKDISQAAEVDALILAALRAIIKIGDDFLDKLQEDHSTEDNEVHMPTENVKELANEMLRDIKGLVSEELFTSAKSLLDIARNPEEKQQFREFFGHLLKHLTEEKQKSEGAVYKSVSAFVENEAAALLPAKTSKWNSISFKTLRVFPVVTGKTCGAHEFILDKVTINKSIKISTKQEDFDIVIIFCPIISRVESDVQKAIKKCKDLLSKKHAILVVMHHTRKPNYSTGEDNSLYPHCPKVLLHVDVLFHETVQCGFLECEKNDAALDQIQKTILSYRY